MCHVGSRGNDRQAIYRDDADRLEFLEVLERVAADAGWNVLAHCLIGNHYHLVVEVPNGELAAGMHRLNSTYAKRFNHRYARKGHVFERRYWSDDIEDEDHLLSVIGYVGRNPVRAGLCGRAGEWVWSSVGPAIGEKSCPPYLNVKRLWQLVGGIEAEAQAQLRRMYDEEARSPAETLREAIRQQVTEAHHSEGLSVHEVAEALQLSTASVLKLMR
jgi:REP element-mobilizing transposase RayT